VGASAGVVADELWLAVRALTSTAVVGFGGVAESVVTAVAHGVLLDGGGLLALAALVYLLAKRGSDVPGA
jgi:hypothetical protein